jgi:hypothetical protein
MRNNFGKSLPCASQQFIHSMEHSPSWEANSTLS